MKTYIYKAIDKGDRGFNRTIVVYRVINNKPVYLGSNSQIDTASTYGDKGEAVRLIGKLCGHKHDNYSFLSGNINLWSI